MHLFYLVKRVSWLLSPIPPTYMHVLPITWSTVCAFNLLYIYIQTDNLSRQPVGWRATLSPGSQHKSAHVHIHTPIRIALAQVREWKRIKQPHKTPQVIQQRTCHRTTRDSPYIHISWATLERRDAIMTLKMATYDLSIERASRSIYALCIGFQVPQIGPKVTCGT